MCVYEQEVKGLLGESLGENVCQIVFSVDPKDFNVAACNFFLVEVVLSGYVLVAWRYEVFLAEFVRLDVIAVAFCRCLYDASVS